MAGITSDKKKVVFLKPTAEGAILFFALLPFFLFIVFFLFAPLQYAWAERILLIMLPPIVLDYLLVSIFDYLARNQTTRIRIFLPLVVIATVYAILFLYLQNIIS